MSGKIANRISIIFYTVKNKLIPFLTYFNKFSRWIGKLLRYILIVLLFITIARIVVLVLQVFPVEFEEWWGVGITSAIYFVAIKDSLIEGLSLKVVAIWIVALASIHIIYKFIEDNIYQNDHGQ